MNRFSFQGSVNRLESVMKNIVDQLSSRLEEFANARRVIPIDQAFNCMATDVVSKYTSSTSYNYLDRPISKRRCMW